ncbi:MAG: inositol transport system substrate-binding protein [Gammaproteobacteria bacterium]|jgi:inositol transport system substrate-binding protein|nr:inositol transport system substrate-binding protein [Gammaproteobacteria bacterium]
MNRKLACPAFTTCLLLTSMMLAVLGCSGKSAGNSVQLVASLHDMTEPFFVAVKRELDTEAAKLGVLVSVEDGQSNSAKQTADIEAAIAAGAQGIILAPNDVNALAPAVEDVIKAGIPIVTLDRRVDNTSVKVPHVGADNVAGGRIMGQWVIDSFANGARILLITGQLGSSPSIDRTRGIKETLGAAGPKYQIVAEQTGTWKREQGLIVTQNVLTSLGSQSLQAIVAESDDMALGALEALRSSGVSGVKVIGFDAIPEALKLVRSGEMAATVEQSPKAQAQTALRQLAARVRQQTPIAGASIVPVLITQSNINQAERMGEVR